MDERYTHSEDRLAKLRANNAVLHVNLLHGGLSHPNCIVAYRAAIFAGASPEIAFEAARQEALIALPPYAAPQYAAGEDPLYTKRNLDARRASGREEVIRRVRAKPNPFAQPEGAIQHGNADLMPTSHQSLGRAA